MAASVSICLTNGVIRAPLRSARTAISSVPIRAPIWRSEKPDFFAWSSVVAGSVSEWKKTDRAWPPFSEDLVGSEVKVLVDGSSLAAEIIEVAEAMAELDGLNGVCIRFRDDEDADEEWHEYGTEDILFVREEPVASPGSFFR